MSTEPEIVTLYGIDDGWTSGAAPKLVTAQARRTKVSYIIESGHGRAWDHLTRLPASSVHLTPDSAIDAYEEKYQRKLDYARKAVEAARESVRAAKQLRNELKASRT